MEKGDFQKFCPAVFVIFNVIRYKCQVMAIAYITLYSIPKGSLGEPVASGLLLLWRI